MTDIIKSSPYSSIGKKNFHITLIRPPAIWVRHGMNISAATPPLALAYLSSYLRSHDFSVTNIDALGLGLDTITIPAWNDKIEAQGLSPLEIINLIPESTNLIGISCMFSIEWPYTKSIISLIREKFPNTPIVAGGEHISALPEFSLQQCPAIDYVALGEGENLLLHLTELLYLGKKIPSIPGFLYREGEKIIRSGNTPLERSFNGASGVRIKALDSIPPPAWDITPIETYLNKKLTFGRYVGKTMPIVGSRGCPYECTFCSNPTMWGRRYVTRSAKEVVEEIIFYKEKYQIEAVEFYDLTPIITKKWILEFADELLARDVNIKWQISGGTRCEAIDEEVIIRIKKAGCEYVGFAPESGVQSVLDRIKKRINLDHLLNLIRISKRHKMDTRCNLIIGFPEDTRTQIWQSLLFQVRLAWMGVVDCPMFHFVPYPGSALFKQLSDEKIIGSLSDEYFESLGGNFQLNSPKNYCKNVPFLELMMYRMAGTTLFYAITYLRHPMKLFSFIQNIFDYQRSGSVFEQRIIQNINRLKKKSQNG